MKDVLDLPASHLRIRIENRPMTEVVVERMERRRLDL